jgi:hypothetical protein
MDEGLFWDKYDATRIILLTDNDYKEYEENETYPETDNFYYCETAWYGPDEYANPDRYTNLDSLD